MVTVVGEPSVAVVLFTRDLRVHDHPALHAASRVAQRIVPLFVVDPHLPSSRNRQRFLAECLADLRESLRHRGGDLVVRYGDPVVETVALARTVGATRIVVAADSSRYAAVRQRRLAAAARTERLDLTIVDSTTVVPPGVLRPAGGGDHYRIFTPYWRAWQAHPRRRPLAAPRRVILPAGVQPGHLPEPGPAGSPDVLPGGESAGRRRLDRWRRQVGDYPQTHDDLAAGRTSRLSPYLHFGCVSPVAVVAATDGARGGGDEFIRQLCWRDFYHQLLRAFPDLPCRPYRAGARDDWTVDADALSTWHSGRTGIPVVDAGMRQLAAEGYMHNRARLVTAGYLTRKLGLDWRDGAGWYARWLLDADVANNNGNWQWVAGTGTDPRPNRGFNPIRQALRYDPDGAYVRRYVPELASVPGPAVHQPWRLPDAVRRTLRYPGTTEPRS